MKSIEKDYIQEVQPQLIGNKLLSEFRDCSEPIFFPDECKEIVDSIKENFSSSMIGDVICIDSNVRVHDIVQEYGFIGMYYPHWFIRAQTETAYHKIKKLPLKRHFSFLNGNPWPGRVKLLSRLYEENLLDSCYWTLNNAPQEDILAKLNINEDFLKLVPKSWDGRKFQQKSIRGFGDGDYPSIYDFNRKDIPIFKRCAVNIVVETDFTSEEKNDVFLTGKIAKTIAMKMPWILLCNNEGGSNRIMESLGFKTFHESWPEQYNKYSTPEEQIESVIETMRFILLMDKEEIVEKTKKVCDYNYKVLMSMKNDVLSNKDLIGFKDV